MRGFKAVHERTQETLTSLGVTNDDVPQGWGDAVASAGYHAPVGISPAGRKYSDCVDLSPRPQFLERDFFDRAAAAGLIAFPRVDGRMTPHVHCVQIGLTDAAGKCRILAGPRAQIIDALSGRNGLVGHALMDKRWRLAAGQVKTLRAEYDAWAPHVRTKVYQGEAWVPCYAFFEGERSSVSCEVRKFVEGLGGSLIMAQATDHGENQPGRIILRRANGLRIDRCTDLWLAGDFMRGTVADLATYMGYKSRMDWQDASRTWAKVLLT